MCPNTSCLLWFNFNVASGGRGGGVGGVIFVKDFCFPSKIINQHYQSLIVCLG